MTFKDQFIEFQRIALEIKRVRAHNLSFTADSLDLFFFAEGMLVLLAFERFLRMILGADAGEKDTLPNLLEKATSKERNLIVIPGRMDRDETIRAIRRVRNVLMHGNYEQAAKESGLASKDEYFRTGRYIKDVELLFKIMNRIVAQIDRDTGQPLAPPALATYLASRDFQDLAYEGAGERHQPRRLVEAAPDKNE